MSQQTQELKTISAKQTPRVIVTESLMGCGKSTILPLLQKKLTEKGLKVTIVPEPVALWRSNGILGDFYADMDRFAETFQKVTFVTRINATIQAMEEMPDADVIILERSVLTDRHIFMELQRERVGPKAMERYEWWATTFERLLKPVGVDLSKATYLYIKPSIDVCMERVAKRDCPEETKQAKKGAGITREYMELLQKAHEALFQGMHQEQFPRCQGDKRPFPLSSVVLIPEELANRDFSPEATEEERNEVLGEILKRMGYP